jgi:hypothetical protein
MGQRDDEVRQLTVKGGWWRWSSVWSKWRRAEVKLDGAKCCGANGQRGATFYRVGEAVEGIGGGRW